MNGHWRTVSMKRAPALSLPSLLGFRIHGKQHARWIIFKCPFSVFRGVILNLSRRSRVWWYLALLADGRGVSSVTTSLLGVADPIGAWMSTRALRTRQLKGERHTS